MNKGHDNTDGMTYVKSLRDAGKRRYAMAYLDWIRGGKKGGEPSRGLLAPALAKAVCRNLDALG